MVLGVPCTRACFCTLLRGSPTGAGRPCWPALRSLGLGKYLSAAFRGPAPTPLEADVPCSGLRKGGLLHKHSRQHATKTQCWSSCKDPPFPTPPACPPASTSTTSTASTTCLLHPPPTLLPPPRPARLLSYSLPAYTTRRGGPVPGGLPLPRPALLLRSQTTDLATLIDTPFDYRKRRQKRPTTSLHSSHFLCLAPPRPARRGGGDEFRDQGRDTKLRRREAHAASVRE